VILSLVNNQHRSKQVKIRGKIVMVCEITKLEKIRIKTQLYSKVKVKER
jgi:hypothetical protein